ncbi:HEPN domain-containing protein [Pacificibacter marinus]|uniref:HEPN domain-containing protein n=1 Tax=Pacificibacter marinus TaxID=658057 RepID=UPI001C07261F|nr:HEPN domain-containing protein [Pacificibacter marinus]MBU2868838.1 HEPN domain-containing protein [Pacificibacter marinus]
MSQSKLSSKAQCLVERTVLLTYGMAAVEDYSMARLSWEKQSYRSFGWNAGQCTEKLLKACLLINGKNAKFGHPKIGEYKEFIEQESCLIGGKLHLPKNLCELDDEPYDEDLETFVERLIKLGQTNLRYLEVSYEFDTYDLHKFDELVFRLSRCLIPLDSRWRNFLKENPGHVHSEFSQLVDLEHQHMFYKNNYSFNPHSTDNKPQLAVGFGRDGLQELNRCYKERTFEGMEAYKFLSESSKLLPKNKLPSA